MKLLLFMLLTNLTIHSKVVFQKKVYSIVDVTIVTPLSSGLFKQPFYIPFKFIVTIKNKYGGIEIVGRKVIKSIFESWLSYSEVNSEL